MKITLLLAGAIGASVVLLNGCKSARYEIEAEGLAYEETITAVTVKGMPGGAVVGTLDVQAKVLDVDHRKREIKLLVPGGDVIETTVGPEAANFDQIQKGDIVHAAITEELVFQLGSDEAEMKDHAEVVAVLSEQGEMPAGVVAAAARISATINAIDVEARSVDLTFNDGTTKTVPVREDVAMDKANVGDQVVIDVFEAVAISVEKQEPK